MTKPLVLITNDDGIDSYFLHLLVQAMQERFDVAVAAPLSEQSWIGRAISRTREVHLTTYNGFDCPAWTVDGTPSDCVNIALEHLLPRQPDAVVSGINLGYNASVPLLLSSGTIAGAIEGAAWGLPALAFSHQIPEDLFEIVRRDHGRVEGAFEDSLKAAAAHAVRFTAKRIGKTNTGLTVHNINFPAETTERTPIEHTQPSRFFHGGLFEAKTPTSYVFSYCPGRRLSDDDREDSLCLLRGNISYTVINYAELGMLPARSKSRAD